MAQPIVVTSSSAINGNIGSCKVNKEVLDVSSFYTQTIAVNSCTGEIVSNNAYYNWGYLYYPTATVLVIFSIVASIGILFKILDRI